MMWRGRSAGRGALLAGALRETGGALAQAVRRPERQVRLARLVRQPTTDVTDLDRVDAANVGRVACCHLRPWRSPASRPGHPADRDLTVLHNQS